MESEREHIIESQKSRYHEIATGVQFPGGLSEKDKELIVTQCVHQNATRPEQILGFAEAYKKAKELAASPEELASLSSDNVQELIHSLALCIEPKDASAFRKVPAFFRDTSLALDPEKIERAMGNFSEAFAEGRLTSEEAYREFERIHPFLDGNGRVGDLLWKLAVARETGQWPEEFPPDIFKKELESENS